MNIKALYLDNDLLVEIEIISLTKIDGDFIKTNKGLLFAGTIFPISMRQQLEDHIKKVLVAKKTLQELQGELYRLGNQAHSFRKGL